MLEKLIALFANRTKYDEATRNTIEDLRKSADNLAKLEELKQLDGWKLLEQSIRDELRTTILAMISEDKTERGGRISSLMQVLSAVNTKPQAQQLEEIINNLI